MHEKRICKYVYGVRKLPLIQKHITYGKAVQSLINKLYLKSKLVLCNVRREKRTVFVDLIYDAHQWLLFTVTSQVV